MKIWFAQDLSITILYRLIFKSNIDNQHGIYLTSDNLHGVFSPIEQIAFIEKIPHYHIADQAMTSESIVVVDRELQILEVYF